MNPTTTSTCRSCGGAVLPGDRFCGSCGASIPPAPATEREAALTVPDSGLPDTSPWGIVASRLQAVTLGEFEIMTELGRGGMAAVYLARDLALNRRVAIKVMAPGLLHGPGMIERFRQEAVTVANLQHAHIVSIHAVRQLEDLHFFVMQFVPGRTLEGVLRLGEELPIGVVRAWLYQIGAALGYAHRRGVIHRDIKPGNILLNADGEAIVTDFGIAKVAESPSHTQTGTVVGTPVYMSPEQCFAKELTGASDQYSLGVVAYEMLAGRPPFSGSSFALMRAHTDEPPPPVRDARPDVPPSMEAALLRMLAKRPEERFPTLAEALVSLGAGPIAPDDPVHATLQRFAAVTERLEKLGDVLRTPHSPVPKTRERQRAAEVVAPQPRTPVPLTEVLVVAIAPSPELEPGASVALRVAVKNAAGQPAPHGELRWTSSAPEVISIDASTGTIKALKVGTSVVSATVGASHDSIEVEVGEPRPASIAVGAPSGPLSVGDRAVVSAAVTNRYGVRVSRPVSWSVDENAVASVEPTVAREEGATATVRARSPGTVTVIATCDGVVGRATLRVLAPPVTTPTPTQRVPAAPLSATVVLPPVSPAPAPNAPLASAPPTDASKPNAPSPNAPSPSAPSPSEPPSAAVAAGTTTDDRRRSLGALRWTVPAAIVLGAVVWFVVSQSSTTPSGTATVTPARDSAVSSDTTVKTVPDAVPTAPDSPAVAIQPVDSATANRPDSSTAAPPAVVPRRIELAPARPAAVEPGQTLTLSAIVRDQTGARMRNARVTWTSSDPRVGTVDPATGVVRALGPGNTRVTARIGDVTSAVTVLVTPAAPDPTIVATIEMSEGSTMTAGETMRLTATPRNAAGAAVVGTTVEWSSSDQDVATVAANGVVTARSAGSTTIRATAGNRTVDRVLTVRARVVVTRPDPPVTPPAPAPKTEAELRSDIQAVLAMYVRAIETRDTSLIRRAFPNVDGKRISDWQATFNDARGAIRMTGGPGELLDTPRDGSGAQVRVRARYTVRFASRRGGDLSYPMEFEARVQRDSTGWRIVGIR